MSKTVVNVGDAEGPADALKDTEALAGSSSGGAVTLPLLGFRQALQAIKPHAGGPKDLPEFQTVRILPGPKHSHVVATDRYTMALAAVPTSDLSMEELDPVDLHVDDVAKVLAVFKMPSDKDLWPDCVIRIEPRGSDISITDAGGLFDGQELVIPAHPQRNFPDVPSALGNWLAEARQVAYPPAQDRGLAGTAVVKLATAVKTYDEAAYIQPTSSDAKAAHLVLIGDRFLAVAMPVQTDEDSDWNPTQWRQDWAIALPRRSA